ncbi:DL-endopeptidase inhibitor IseA family protein [Paenibacillus pectinilyticus]|nr:DL-endopeptidase inhibitor IseA family protein [Paenibacillus pectinilyticus]
MEKITRELLLSIHEYPKLWGNLQKFINKALCEITGNNQITHKRMKYMNIFIILILLLQNLVIGNNQNQSVPELSQELALKLRAEGLKRSSTFIDGGSACDQVERNTQANQDGYYYFCSDLDTYGEMYQYLEETFTHNIAKKLIESVVVVINNRLSYQSVGWGSMNDWSRAIGMIASRDENTITYKFKVPVFGDDYPTDEIQIEYKYITNKGWRINSPARLLR